MPGGLRRLERFVEENKGFFLLGIFAAAFLARLLFNFLFLENISSIGTRGFTGSDPYAYYTAAHEIQNLNYALFDRAPFLPLVIATVQSLVGRDPIHLRIVMSLLGALSCVLTFLVGELAFNRRVAIFSSLVAVFYIPFWVLNSMIMPGSVFMVLTLLVLLLMLKTFQNGKSSYCLLIGACLGCAALTRPEFTLVIVLLLLFAFILRRKEAYTRCVLIMLAAVMILIIPWTAYASVKNETLVTISTSGGGTFLGCNNPRILESEFWRKGFFMTRDKSGLVSEEDEKELAQLPTPGKRSNWLYRRSLRWLADNPGSIPELEAWKFYSFWFYPIQTISRFQTKHSKDNKRTILMILFAAQYFIILFMFLLGAIKTFELRKHFPFLAYFLGGLAIVLIYGCDWRIIIFLQPIYIMFAGALIYAKRVRLLKT